MNSIKKGDTIIVDIEKNVFGGEGLARYNDMIIFVPMSIKGEKLEVRIISTKKDYARGLITKIINKSPYRVDDGKISFEDYDACDYMMMTYDHQLRTKEEIFFDEMRRCNIGDFKYNGILESENKINYRNKVSEPFCIVNGMVKTGFYKKKSHDIFVAEEDHLKSNESKIITKLLLEEINEYRKKYKISVFNDNTNKGSLKQLIIRNNLNKDIMIVIVINKSNEIKHVETILNTFISKYEKMLCEKYKIVLKSIYISIKNKIDNYILGDKEKLIYGIPYIEETIDDIKFKIYPKSFFQINVLQAKKLYNEVIKYLGKNNKKVIDAYSGTGTIAMMVSKTSDKVIAIENSKESVTSGKKTIKENSIRNVEYILGKVEDKINLEICKDVDTIIFDPPRKGLDGNILKYISNIDKIIYVSCNLSTYIRDVKLLNEMGYFLKEVTLVDMFPQTHHLEIVSIIEKRR